MAQSSKYFQSAVRAPRKNYFVCGISKPCRPDLAQGIATKFTMCSTAFLSSSSCDSLRHFRCACTALFLYALHFHGVRTALTVCRQNRNEISLILYVCLGIQRSMKLSMLKTSANSNHGRTQCILHLWALLCLGVMSNQQSKASTTMCI